MILQDLGKNLSLLDKSCQDLGKILLKLENFIRSCQSYDI